MRSKADGNDRAGQAPTETFSAVPGPMTKQMQPGNSTTAEADDRLPVPVGEESPLHRLAEMRHDKDAIRRLFETGEYPYKRKISRQSYERQKAELQVELLKVQEWVKQTGQKIVLLFEGRDAAGKGGTIKRFTEHLNPRGARGVALEKPTEREKSQWYFQRWRATIKVRLQRQSG